MVTLEKCANICQNTALLTCLPQFDTMRLSMCLGVIFNDSILGQVLSELCASIYFHNLFTL